MLTKDLLRVSRAGGGYRPQFASADDEALAGRVLGVYQGHVGQSRGDLRAALDDLEREAEDFKLVRGFAKLLEREADFEVRSPVDPQRTRRVAFAAAEDVGVVTPAERERALSRAADRLGTDVDGVETALYADREVREIVAAVDPRWLPAALVTQYNLSLAQTALFDATEVRVRTDDPRGLVSAIKRLGLLYEVETTDAGREVVLTGPDALFRHTRRYGTRFARVLRTVAGGESWRLEATIDDRGTERTLVLDDDDPVGVPDADPVAEVSYDSDVEREFAARFSALDLDWDLVREPALFDAGDTVMIPDFAFDYAHADFRVFFEIMGFWTPAYVEKKLAQLDAVDDVSMLVAYDDSLGVDDSPDEPSASQDAARSGDVGDAVEARDHRAIPYAGSVRVKDVVDALREFEDDLVSVHAAALPDELVPDADVVTIADLADARGVSEAAVERTEFPEHEVVGRTLVRPAVLDALREDVESGMALSTAEDVLAEQGISDASAALSALGYRVEWDGLSGGTLREK